MYFCFSGTHTWTCSFQKLPEIAVLRVARCSSRRTNANCYIIKLKIALRAIKTLIKAQSFVMHFAQPVRYHHWWSKSHWKEHRLKLVCIQEELRPFLEYLLFRCTSGSKRTRVLLRGVIHTCWNSLLLLTNSFGNNYSQARRNCSCVDLADCKWTFLSDTSNTRKGNVPDSKSKHFQVSSNPTIFLLGQHWVCLHHKGIQISQHWPGIQGNHTLYNKRGTLMKPFLKWT